MEMLKKYAIYINNRSLLNGFFFSLFSFINQGFLFLLMLVLANYLVPSEYGYISLYSTVVMVVNLFVCLSMDGFLSVAYFKPGGKDNVGQVISCTLYTSLTIIFLNFVVLLLFGESISARLYLPLHIILITFVVSFFNVFFSIANNLNRINGKVVAYGLMSCGKALSLCLLCICFIKYGMLGWKGRPYADIICAVGFGAPCILLFMAKGYIGKVKVSYWKSILAWRLPLLPHIATSFIKQGLDRYIINTSHSIYDVGIFCFALNLTNIIITIGVGFNQVNSIDIFKVLGDKQISNELKKETLQKQTKKIWLIYTFTSILVVISCVVFVPLLLPNYSPSLYYFVILAFSGYANCIYYLYCNYLFYFDKTKQLMYITFLSAIIHLLLSLTLTRYSLYYTSIIYVLSQAIVTIIVMIVSKKLLNKLNIMD